MNDLSPAVLAQVPVASASAILAAAGLLLPSLERGQRVDSPMLRTAMESAFGASAKPRPTSSSRPPAPISHRVRARAPSIAT
jgi:hypothetical protein